MSSVATLRGSAAAGLRPTPSSLWLSPAECAALSPDIVIERCRALKPMLAANAGEAERLRAPVDSVWNALRKSGLFHLLVPRRFGGLAADPDHFIDAILPLAEGCSSTAWVASFCVEHNWLLAQFPEQAQEEIFGEFPFIIAPAVTMPPGIAVPAPGGYTIDAQWKWGSGVMHADWVIGNVLIPEGDRQTLVMAIFPAKEARVIDTWNMSGMAGTGSHDIAVENVFVPSHRLAPIMPIAEGRGLAARLYPEPVYKATMLPFLAMSAAIPAVGTARAAVEWFRNYLCSHSKSGSDTKQMERPAAQIRLSKADICVKTAELILRGAGRQNLDLHNLTGSEQTRERIRLRAQISYSVRLCKEAVQQICDGAGSSIHSLDNPVQRALRDISVIASHIAFDEDIANELHGRAMLGLPPNSKLT